MMRTATCTLCEASCGILVATDGEHIRSILGDPEDPFSRGYICPKASALADLHDDPDRVRAPLIREGTRWREVSWEDALDRAADGLVRAREEHGRDAVAMYYGNPHGWGHDRSGTRLGVAREHAGVSMNDVTSDRHLDTLSGTAAFNGLAVTLQRAEPEAVSRHTPIGAGEAALLGYLHDA